MLKRWKYDPAMMVRLSLDQAQTEIIEEMRVRDFVDREIDAMVQIRIKGFEHRKVWQQKKKMFSAMVLKSLYFSEFYQREIFLEFYRVDLDYSKYFWKT
jgi:hypothetical protein